MCCQPFNGLFFSDIQCLLNYTQELTWWPIYSFIMHIVHGYYLCYRITISIFVLQSPSLNWRDVVKEFDHPGFLISSKQGLQLVVTAVRKVLHGAFPVEELYKPWSNSEGQVRCLYSVYAADCVVESMKCMFVKIKQFLIIPNPMNRRD